jgi:hypothetical protein
MRKSLSAMMRYSPSPGSTTRRSATRSRSLASPSAPNLLAVVVEDFRYRIESDAPQEVQEGRGLLGQYAESDFDL